ncbi:peptidoglycan-recognition protein SC2-like isoform X2 [Babylonia areolata]
MYTSFLVLLIAAIGGGTARASQCACATGHLHLRHEPGTSHGIITTLEPQQCLPYSGQQHVADGYTWFHLYYNGQDAWAASNWLTVQDCSQPELQLPGCPRIITRAEWGARPPANHIGDMPNVPVYVFIHHGDSSPCFDENSCKSKVRGYQNYHLDGRGWSDIGYNFVVGEDGNAYEARGWTKIGAHTKHYNSVGIAICFIGNFENHVPNTAALTTVQQLIQCGLDNGKISPSYTLKGHRDVGSTSCPGTSLYQLIQGWSHYVSGTSQYNGGSLVG